MSGWLTRLVSDGVPTATALRPRHRTAFEEARPATPEDGGWPFAPSVDPPPRVPEPSTLPEEPAEQGLAVVPSLRPEGPPAPIEPVPALLPRASGSEPPLELPRFVDDESAPPPSSEAIDEAAPLAVEGPPPRAPARRRAPALRPKPRSVAEREASAPAGAASTEDARSPGLEPEYRRRVALPPGDLFRDLHIVIDRVVVQSAPPEPVAASRPPPRPPLGPRESLSDYFDRRDGKKR